MPDAVREKPTSLRTPDRPTIHQPANTPPLKSNIGIVETSEKWEMETTERDKRRRQIRLSHLEANARVILTRNADPIEAYLYDTFGMLEAMLKAGKITSRWSKHRRLYIHTYYFPSTTDKFKPPTENLDAGANDRPPQLEVQP